MAAPPSGEQVEIRNGSQAATVVTVGGGIRSYAIGGTNVLDGYAADAQCDGARGQQLVPWPNRVRDGRWTWQGVDRQLALTEPDQHNAIHGLARWVNWQVDERSADAVTLKVRISPQPGWSWPLDITSTHALTATGLTVRTTITNLGTTRAPVAAGAHPYLTAGTDLVDQCTLQIPAATWLPTGAKQIPIATLPLDATPWDHRDAKHIGDLKIDYAFGSVIRDADGKARVRLCAPDGRWTALWVDKSFAWLEIFTGDSLPDATRRRRGLGVEPMSAPPDALNTGQGLTVLEPGQTWAGEWGVESSLLGQDAPQP